MYTTKTASIPLLAHIHTDDRIPNENERREANDHANQDNNRINAKVLYIAEESLQLRSKTNSNVNIK